MSLQIDTGSSDIWVAVTGSPFCEEIGDPCAPYGTYSNATSSTYEYVNSLFFIEYGDGSVAEGDYALETITLPSALLGFGNADV